MILLTYAGTCWTYFRLDYLMLQILRFIHIIHKFRYINTKWCYHIETQKHRQIHKHTNIHYVTTLNYIHIHPHARTHTHDYFKEIKAKAMWNTLELDDTDVCKIIKQNNLVFLCTVRVAVCVPIKFWYLSIKIFSLHFNKNYSIF